MKHKKFIQTQFPVTNRSTQANWHDHCAAHHCCNYPLLFSNLPRDLIVPIAKGNSGNVFLCVVIYKMSTQAQQLMNLNLH